MTLIEALQTVPDHRHERGKRHSLWVLLVFVVMGNLAGYRENCPLQEFSQRDGHGGVRERFRPVISIRGGNATRAALAAHNSI